MRSIALWHGSEAVSPFLTYMGKGTRKRKALPSHIKPREQAPEWIRWQEATIGAPIWIHDIAKEVEKVKDPTEKFKLALDAVVEHGVERNKDFLEICSGWGESCYWVREYGGTAQEYDAATRQSKDEDMTSEVGLVLLIYHVCRLKEGATGLLSPECSTWLQWLSVYTTIRDAGVWGDQDKIEVVKANRCNIVASAMYDFNDDGSVSYTHLTLPTILLV